MVATNQSRQTAANILPDGKKTREKQGDQFKNLPPGQFCIIIIIITLVFQLSQLNGETKSIIFRMIISEKQHDNEMKTLSLIHKIIPVVTIALALNFFAGPAKAQADNYIDLIRTEAEKGVAMMQYSLGRIYYEGKELDRSYKTAFTWFKKAADQGYAHAQNDIGMMYYYGSGVKQDLNEAFKWFRKAAKLGNMDALNNLGLMYYEGKGVISPNYKKAVALFTEAAELGSSYAKNNLGLMYYEGKGVPQDYVKAYMWFNIAATDDGNETAIKNRRLAAELMSKSQIAEAQRKIWVR